MFHSHKMRSDIYFVISSLAILVSQLSPILGDLWQDTEIYMTCKGRPSGLSKYFKSQTTALATCLTYKGKYCRIQCIMTKGGAIDEETNQFTGEHLRSKFLEATQIDKETRFQVLDAAESCFKDRTYNNDGRCNSMRKAAYCFHNEYIKLCGINKAPKDQDKFSEETGAVEDAVSTGIGVVDSGALDGVV